MNNFQVVVEFTGISRVLTRETEFPLSLAKGAAMGDVVQSIGKKYPSLVGEVIAKDGKTLIPTDLFSINGEQILHEKDLKFQPKNGDRLILLSLLAGG